VGNDGETLVADSSTSTGLRYQGNFAAGKNKIINGDFGIWQRGTSFTSPSNVYTADRFQANGITGDVVSRQTFTPGTAPVAGYEGEYFLRYASSATAGTRYFFQKVEDVRTFAGQTVTFSFWARVNSGTASLTTYFYQQFGSGGSADVQSSSGTYTVTTAWQRITFTITMPSVSGKTIGAGSLVQAAFLFSDVSKNLDIWGYQLEASNTATAFQTATGTIQGELAACQRYFYKMTGVSGTDPFGVGTAISSTSIVIQTALPVTMRTAPTGVYTGTFRVGGGTTITGIDAASLSLNQSFTQQILTLVTTTGLTAGWGMFMLANGDASIALSSEL
jgi:hypothetical protein